MTINYNIMIMCEPGTQPVPAVNEMINLALQVSAGRACRITAVMPCSGISPGPLRGADLLVLEGRVFRDYSSEAWEKTALAASQKIEPDLIIIPHTATGHDYAPRLAARLGAPCITSVTAVEKPQGRILFKRSGFYGKLDMLYDAGKNPAVITVMPGAFNPAEPPLDYGAFEHMDHSICLESISGILVTATPGENPELENAEVIVSAGRGIGKQENLGLIKAMAALFPKSSIAGSRVLCDNGWMEYRYQVGLTGKKVSPLLYVACGISGSPQHVAGMKNSGTVVAVNRDPGAAIFSHSDICIVEDLEKFIPAFIETAQRHNQR